MASQFQEIQRKKQVNLIVNSDLFDGVSGGGKFMGKLREFVLTKSEHNLYCPIREDVIQYFRENKISWWGGSKPTGHTLSSQISCLNHLFAIRKDEQAVLTLLNHLTDGQFVRVLPIITDADNAYIQFESVSDCDYLNESSSTRGTQCTSIDALIYAFHANGEKWIIPIEWKYTEHYNNDNKAAGEKGIVRQRRYNDLIRHSKSLKSDEISLYYFEPFYQLMRQTLWAEQMICNKSKERIKADNYIHLHVIPSENIDLLDKKYPVSDLGMEDSWRNYLKEQSKYKIINHQEIVKAISKMPKYNELAEYLRSRYL